MPYFEGGSLIPNKSPGRLTFSDVALERGATEDRDLFDGFQDVAITSSGLGLTDVNDKRNLDIVQQDRDGTTVRRSSRSRARPRSTLRSAAARKRFSRVSSPAWSCRSPGDGRPGWIRRTA